MNEDISFVGLFGRFLLFSEYSLGYYYPRDISCNLMLTREGNADSDFTTDVGDNGLTWL